MLKEKLLRAKPLFALLFLAACVKTEIIPEVLEPKLRLLSRSAGLVVGQTLQLQVIYIDEQNKERSDLLQWRSNAPRVVKVSASGVLRAKAPGQSWVVIWVPDKIADSVLVTVTADPNAVARVNIVGFVNSISVGATVQFSATVQNSSGVFLTDKTI